MLLDVYYTGNMAKFSLHWHITFLKSQRGKQRSDSTLQLLFTLTLWGRKGLRALYQCLQIEPIDEHDGWSIKNFDQVQQIPKLSFFASQWPCVTTRHLIKTQSVEQLKCPHFQTQLKLTYMVLYLYFWLQNKYIRYSAGDEGFKLQRHTGGPHLREGWRVKLHRGCCCWFPSWAEWLARWRC